MFVFINFQIFTKKNPQSTNSIIVRNVANLKKISEFKKLKRKVAEQHQIILLLKTAFKQGIIFFCLSYFRFSSFVEIHFYSFIL